MAFNLTMVWPPHGINPQRLEPFSNDIHTIDLNMKIARCWLAYSSRDTFHFEQEISCTVSKDPNKTPSSFTLLSRQYKLSKGNWCPFIDHMVGTLKYGWVVFYIFEPQSSSWIGCWSKFSTSSSFIGTILIIVGLFLTSWGQRASGKMLPTLDNQSTTNSSSNGLKEPLLGWELLNFNLFFVFVLFDGASRSIA